jgi:hypothetical protein
MARTTVSEGDAMCKAANREWWIVSAGSITGEILSLVQLARRPGSEPISFLRTNAVRIAYCLMSNHSSHFFAEYDSFMEHFSKPFVHLPIDAVDSVVFDPEGRFEAELYDRYTCFTEARDAALSSIEIMLDEADYDGEDHRQELEQMLGLLDSSSSYEELERHPEYQRIVDRLDLVRSWAA